MKSLSQNNNDKNNETPKPKIIITRINEIPKPKIIIARINEIPKPKNNNCEK